MIYNNSDANASEVRVCFRCAICDAPIREGEKHWHIMNEDGADMRFCQYCIDDCEETAEYEE